MGDSHGCRGGCGREVPVRWRHCLACRAYFAAAKVEKVLSNTSEWNPEGDAKTFDGEP